MQQANKTLVFCLLLLSLVALGQSHYRTTSRRIKPYAPFANYGTTECSGQFKCKAGQKRFSPMKCLSTDQVCDGHVDCMDGEDERTCKTLKTCDVQAFSCADGQYSCLHEEKCIPASQVCNRKNECLHGDDEQQCPHDKYQCTGGEVSIPFALICDGVVNCPLGDDEEYCGNIGRSCNCPDSWIPYNDSCYLFPDITLQFVQAWPYCRELHPNAHMAEVDSQGEYDFLLSMFGTLQLNVWWTGLWDLNDEGNWTLVSSGQEPTFTNWGNNEPDGGVGQSCGTIIKLGGFVMKSWNCEAKLRTVCEIWND